MIKKWASFNESSDYLGSLTDAFQDISDEYGTKIETFSNEVYVITIDIRNLNVDGSVDIENIHDIIQKHNDRIELLNLIYSSVKRAEPIKQNIHVGPYEICITLEYSDSDGYFSIGTTIDGHKKYIIYKSRLESLVKDKFKIENSVEEEEGNLYIFIEDGTDMGDSKVQELINMIKKDLKDIIYEDWIIEEDEGGEGGPPIIGFGFSPYNDPDHTGDEIIIQIDK